MSEPYIGEIRLFGGSFAPAGWAFCNGASMAISQNDTLFVLIGTTYGGDGEETFNLPDLQGRLPVHQGTLNGVTYTIGERSGTEEVTLTLAQIPAHTHAFLGTTGTANEASPNNAIPATSTTFDPYIADTPINPMAPAISPVGGSQPHSNMQPYLVVSFIISLFGIFPSQG